MAIPINKISDEMVSGQVRVEDLFSVIPLLDLYPFLSFQETKSSSREKEAMKNLWLHSKEIDGEESKIEIIGEINPNDIRFLRSKGFIDGEDTLFEITASGRKTLKEAILDDEECAFTKKACKEIISKNCYDFGDSVLVQVKDKEKFGAKYMVMPKKTQNKWSSKKINNFFIQTKTASGKDKQIKDYSDEELIKVLYLSKNVIKNASSIALNIGKPIPVNRLKCFAEMIMKELNDINRNEKKAQIIPDDGYADGGAPYDDEQMDLFEKKDKITELKREAIRGDSSFREDVYCIKDLSGNAPGNIPVKFTKRAKYFALRENFGDRNVAMFFDAFHAVGNKEIRDKEIIAMIPHNIFIEYFDVEPPK